MNCNQCPDEHTYLCDCGHHHEWHVFAGGCKAKVYKNGSVTKCICEGYSQKKRNKLSN